MLKEGTLEGTYGKRTVYRMQQLIQKWIPVKGKHVLVIGSNRPWIEVILLAEGAANITTLEYNPYDSDHIKINMVSPMELAKHVKDGTAPSFDAMITFSSIEHSGLGR